MTARIMQGHRILEEGASCSSKSSSKMESESHKKEIEVSERRSSGSGSSTKIGRTLPIIFGKRSQQQQPSAGKMVKIE